MMDPTVIVPHAARVTRRRPHPAVGGLRIAALIACLFLTVGITSSVHVHALIGLAYYYAAWSLFVLCFDRRTWRHFTLAYLVNAALTAGYVLVQVHVFPQDFGCTSPLGAQTDDSYFFGLVADEIPPGMPMRENFYLYEDGFTNFVRAVTPFRIVHPLDVLFFLSGAAGLVAVYTRDLAYLIAQKTKIANRAYLLVMFCPLMLMNGGAVFVRDTLVAGVLVLSFSCLLRRRYLALCACFALQFYLRPGTALIQGALFAALAIPHLGRILRRQKKQWINLTLAGLAVGVSLALTFFLRDALSSQLDRAGVSLTELRRTGLEDLLTGSQGRGTFILIQQQVLPLRLVLSTVYMFLGPFFNVAGTMTPTGPDVRLLLMNVIYPIWTVPLHAWVVAGLCARRDESGATVRRWYWVLLAGFFLIGVFSLQSRHRVMIQPLFYVLAAYGAFSSPRWARYVGYGIASSWFVVQLVYFLSH